jgi:tRNA dimethylallyltransferase
LLDIREPEEPYSAGDFVRDASVEIARSRAAGRVPLLVGGTMMYFRALTEGIASLPSADPSLRARIDRQAALAGWPAMHRQLMAIDPAAAVRIDPNDSQRIQRALEVYRQSGKPLSVWQEEAPPAPGRSPFLKFILIPEPRREHHRGIERRFLAMLEAGLVGEVARLRARASLDSRCPSMRAVGYRQIWSYLEGRCSLEEATSRALAATRQLAKRQVTWLRSETEGILLNPLEPDTASAILSVLSQRFGTFRVQSG